jgi:hypothetical protein
LVIVATLGSLMEIVIFNPERPCGISESAIEKSVLDPTGTQESPPLIVNAMALTGEIETIKIRITAMLHGMIEGNCISFLKKWKFSSTILRLSSHTT